MGATGSSTASFTSGGLVATATATTTYRFGNYWAAKATVTANFDNVTIGPKEGDWAVTSQLIPDLYTQYRTVVGTAHQLLGKSCGHAMLAEGHHVAKVSVFDQDFTPIELQQMAFGSEPAVAAQTNCPIAAEPEACWDYNRSGDGPAGYCWGEEMIDCELEQYGLFIRIDGTWYLVYTWWEFTCEDGSGGWYNNTVGASSADPADRKRKYAPVKVVLVPDVAFGDRYATSTFRRTGSANDPTALILLKESTATPETLSNAWAGMQAWLTREKDHETAKLRGEVQISVERSRVYPWATDVLAALKRAPHEDVPGVGRHRATKID